MRLETLDGSTVTLQGALSTRELVVELADAEGDAWELLLSRYQVTQLQEQLTMWLERGQVS